MRSHHCYRPADPPGGRGRRPAPAARPPPPGSRRPAPPPGPTDLARFPDSPVRPRPGWDDRPMALVRSITGTGVLAIALLLLVVAPTAATAGAPADPSALPAAAPVIPVNDRDDNGDDDDDTGNGLWDEPHDPNHERGEVFLELSPSTVLAGDQVEIRAG